MQILTANTEYRFNSIKVRLKLQGHTLALQAVVFQFHKGTIKTTIPFSTENYTLVSIP